LLTLGSALAVVLLDQVSKAAIWLAMTPGESIPVIPGVFHITYVLNPGVAFGMAPGASGLPILASAAAIIGIILFHRRARGWMLRVGLGLAMGGAAGNLVDRLRFQGHVVDFLDFRVWPVFNLADSALVAAAGLILWDTMRSGKEDRR
jgi:signal peptidase II